MSIIEKQLQKSWSRISLLFNIQGESEYYLAVERLNGLIDEVGTDEQYPLYSLLDTLEIALHAYEEKYHPRPECDGADLLRLLMEEHGLTQSDLPEINSPRDTPELVVYC
ncbi:MAG: transcriptional regulator [Candidatus Latescibacteria bacterium]|nr:transcriptional regulator [Candidatus Latescibacterota bacterium]